MTRQPLPFVGESRVLSWALTAVAVPAAAILPFLWTHWSAEGTLVLLALELTLVSIVLVWRDPIRFHWAGRLLMALLAIGAVVVALGASPALRDPVDRVVALVLALPCAFYACTGRLGRQRDPDELRRASYGELVLEGDTVTFRPPKGGSGWTLDARDLRLVGEFTSEDWGDDYRLCFFCASDGSWFEASFYSEGRTETLERLGRTLGAPLELGLCNSTIFRSRIVWPASLRGERLLEMKERPAPRGVLQRILEAAGLRGDLAVPTTTVLEHLTSPR